MARELQETTKSKRENIMNKNKLKEAKIIQSTEFCKPSFVSLEIWDNIASMEKKQIIGNFREWGRAFGN